LLIAAFAALAAAGCDSVLMRQALLPPWYVKDYPSNSRSDLHPRTFLPDLLNNSETHGPPELLSPDQTSRPQHLTDRIHGGLE
jgi:hypothetical protein